MYSTVCVIVLHCHQLVFMVLSMPSSISISSVQQGSLCFLVRLPLAHLHFWISEVQMHVATLSLIQALEVVRRLASSYYHLFMPFDH